ncbi:hypothetical protein V8E54_013878 [Elaphomyces granulatus]
MRLGATLLGTLVVGTATVSALQNIFIGTIGGCGTNKYGTDVGPTQYFGNGLCGKNVTILGHEFITFTGCAIPPYGPIPGPPTGVSDNGIPALTCKPVRLPSQNCPSPCGRPNPDVTVTTNYLCSNIHAF